MTVLSCRIVPPQLRTYIAAECSGQSLQNVLRAVEPILQAGRLINQITETNQHNVLKVMQRYQSHRKTEDSSTVGIDKGARLEY